MESPPLPSSSSTAQPFAAKQFAEIACALTPMTTLPKEARTRSMWGRAYYALHLAVRQEICRQNNWDPDLQANHSPLIQELYRVGLDALAKQLDSLREARVESDYRFAPRPQWAHQLQKPTTAETRAKATLATIAKLDRFDFTGIERERLFR